jgi:hypothetical protein
MCALTLPLKLLIILQPVLIANAPSCITLQWNIPASNGAPITSYTVERRLKGSMDWTVAVADTPSNECQVPKSDAAETVFFRVCAINSGGTSDFGDASEVRDRLLPHSTRHSADTAPIDCLN